eukprot:g75139.t1
MDELCDRLASALKITDVKRLNDIKALLYADDVALIAHSRTELQKMVNVVAKFAEDYRLEVNLKPGKTEIMPIYTSSKAKRPSIRERGEIQARYRLMCWNQLVGAKLKYAFDVWHKPKSQKVDKYGTRLWTVCRHVAHVIHQGNEEGKDPRVLIVTKFNKDLMQPILQAHREPVLGGIECDAMIKGSWYSRHKRRRAERT